MRARTCVFLVVMLFGVFVGGSAGAHEVTHDTTVTYAGIGDHYGADQVFTYVYSSKGGCFKYRLVQLVRHSDREVIDWTYTDNTGYGSIITALTPGVRYFLLAPRSVLGEPSGAHRHRCAAARSPGFKKT